MSTYLVPSFHQLTPSEEIWNRIARFQAVLAADGLDGALLVHPVDIYYYSGTMQSGHLLVPAQSPPLLMIRRDPDRARAESPLETIPLTSLGRLSTTVVERLGHGPRTLGLEMDLLPVNNFQRYQTLWPRTAFRDISPVTMAQRAIKSVHETTWMRRAGELARIVYAQVPQLLTPGLTEIELAGMMTRTAYAGGHQNYLRMRGFDQTMYSWHVISGESGTMPSSIDAAFAGYGLSPAFPTGASLKPIQVGEPVLIDFGLCLGGYQVDLTRMFSLGPPPGLLIDAYQALTRIETTLLTTLLPGTTPDQLYHLAVRTADDLGFSGAFLGPPDRKVRFVGHGVGLEINEPPFLAPGFTRPIQEGMTVALELKMVFPGLGAVGLENTFLVGSSRPEKLTPADDRWSQS